MAAGDKKRVRLMLGDGPDRVEIGEAEIEEMSDGTFQVSAKFNNAGKAIQFLGEIPVLPWKDDQ